MKRQAKLIALYLAKYLGLFRLSRWLTRDGFVIICWHGVSLETEHERKPKYFISREKLRQRLAYLNRVFRLVPLEAAARQHAAGDITPGMAVLTFDDGLYDFKAAAWPVLREFDAPCTVYIVSSTMVAPTIAYNMVVDDLIQLSPLEHVSPVVLPSDRRRSLSDNDDRGWYMQQARQQLDTMPSEQHHSYVVQLAKGLQVPWEPMQAGRYWEYLLETEVRQLSDQGVDMQLHTHTHRTVVGSPELIEQEARQCRLELERVTAKAARDYCYPSGCWEESAWAPLEAAGVRTAATCKLGPNFKSTPRLALRRYVDHQQITQIEFESLVSNFRFLLHVALHPSKWSRPSECHNEHSSLF